MDVNKLIADAQAARAQAEQAAIAAKQAADAKKATSKAINQIKLQVDSKYNYANTLKSTLSDLESQLQVWAVKIARDGKLSPTDQQEFDRIVKQYKSVDKSYSTATKEVNAILAKMPKSTEGDSAKAGFNPVPTGGTISGDGAPKPEPRDYAKEKSTAAATIITLKDADRLKLAEQLNNAGYSVPLTGVFNDRLVGAYQEAVSANAVRNQTLTAANMPELNFDQFLAQKKTETSATNVGTGTSTGRAGTNYDISTNILAPTELAAAVNGAFQDVLGRDATAAEIKTYGSKLNQAIKSSPVKTKVVTDAKGNSQREYSGGIDKTQFLTGLLQGTDEFKSKKQSAGSTISEDLLKTFQANALTPAPGQLEQLVTRVQNGEKADVVKTEIRNLASIGQPDSVKKLLAAGSNLDDVYTPYKTVMSQVLEVPYDKIKLTDPALMSAITPDKEQTLYEYQRTLRKDPRWQYTNTARSETANAITTVLKDFGFMG